MRSASKMELFAKRSTALVCCDSETIVFARTKRSQHDHEIVEVTVETLRNNCNPPGRRSTSIFNKNNTCYKSFW